MQSSATAGIEFHGAVMRYAEVERYGARHRLLRLGDCDFEFNVARAIFSGEDPGRLDIVADALSEIFFGSSAAVCRISVQPPAARVYPSLLDPESPDSESSERLGFESALVFEERAPGSGRSIFGSRSLPPDDSSEAILVQVAEIPAPLVSRVEHLASGIAQAKIELTTSIGAALALLGRLRDENRSGVRIVIGLHEEGTEYLVLRGEECVFYQCRSESGAGDVAYFALHVLEMANVPIDPKPDVVFYGTNGSSEVLGELAFVLKTDIRPIDPTRFLDLDRDRFEEGFRFEAFALCIGAAL